MSFIKGFFKSAEDLSGKQEKFIAARKASNAESFRKELAKVRKADQNGRPIKKQADLKTYRKAMKDWSEYDVRRAAKADNPDNSQEQSKDTQDFAMAARAELEHRRGKK